MRNILAKKPLQQQLYHKNCKKGLLIKQRFVSLDTLFGLQLDEPLLSWHLQQILNKNKQLFPNYQNMFNYPSFIQELIAFLKDCYAFEIAISSLPAQNIFENELKDILKLIDTSNLFDEYRQKIKENKQTISILSDYEITDYVESNAYYQCLLDKANLNVHPYTFQKASSHLRIALNIRQEIEIIAQEICSQQLDTNIVLSDYTNQLPLLKQIFNRYKIPYSIYQDRQFSPLADTFKELLMFSVQKDKKAFFNLIKKGFFKCQLSAKCITVLENFLTKLEFPLPHLPLNKIQQLYGQNSKEFKTYQKYNEKIQAFYQQNEDNILLLTHPQSIVEAIKNAYHILINSTLIKSKEEQTLCFKLGSFLNEIGDEVTDEQLSFFYELLNKFSYIDLPCTLSPILVTDLKHPVLPSKKAYIVGLNSNFYPAMPTKKGVFNEEYYARINYPKFTKRYHDYTNALSWIFHAGEEIFFSYSQKDYEGKNLELAYDIQKLFLAKDIEIIKPLEKKPIAVNHHLKNLPINLNTSLLKPVLNCSISSIEQWYRCPYQYFLNRSLKINNNDLLAPNNAYIGSLVHSLFEKVVKAKKKEYFNMNIQEIKNELAEHFTLWQNLYPQQKNLIALSQSKLIANILSSLKFLCQYEKQFVNLQPLAFEQEFHLVLADKLELNGKIDRIDIDQKQNEYYIYDYKSSKHELKKENFLSGQQIQLMTYKLALEKQNNKVKACYYFSFLPSKLKLDNLQYKFNRKKIEEEPIDYYESDLLPKEFISHQSFSGWYDNNDSCFNKNCLNNSKFKLDNKKLNEITEYLIKYFHEQLLKGVIACQPQDCSFCPYQRICNFKGETLTKILPGIEDLLSKEGKE